MTPEERERREQERDRKWVRSQRRWQELLGAIVFILVFGYLIYQFLLGDL